MNRKEFYQLKLNACQDNTGTSEFKEVKSKRKPVRNHPHVLLIGTSTTRDIDPRKLSSKYSVEKCKAYTLEETATEVSNITEDPDVIIFHSLSNDVKSKSNEECVRLFKEIIDNAVHRFEDTKIIISLPVPRADDEALNNKAQMLGLLVKEIFRDNQRITMCDNSNLSYKGKPVDRFFDSTDQVHLTPNGTAMFAANIRDCIDSVLGLRPRLSQEVKSPRTPNHRYQNDTEDSSSPIYSNSGGYYRGRGNYNVHLNRGGRGHYNRGGRGYYRPRK